MTAAEIVQVGTQVLHALMFPLAPPIECLVVKALIRVILNKQ